MKKKLALILAGLLCALFFASCASSNPTSEKGAEEGSGDQPKMVIAISEQ